MYCSTIHFIVETLERQDKCFKKWKISFQQPYFGRKINAEWYNTRIPLKVFFKTYYGYTKRFYILIYATQAKSNVNYKNSIVVESINFYTFLNQYF
jgi:hypothetical protein